MKRRSFLGFFVAAPAVAAAEMTMVHSETKTEVPLHQPFALCDGEIRLNDADLSPVTAGKLVGGGMEINLGDGVIILRS